MLHRTLGEARDLVRRARGVIVRLLADVEPPASPPPPASFAAPPADALAALSSRLDRLADGLEVWRMRIEADQLAWQRLFVDEARARDARIWDQLARASARPAFDLLEQRGTLRAPRVPSEFAPRTEIAPPAPAQAPRTPPGPSVRGLVENVSLSSLLGMFEIERRDGIFRLGATDGSVELDLRRGAIVRARANGQTCDVVTALGRAFEFGAAEFHFTSVPITADSEAPTSLNGLLLEVFQRQDEARRAG